MTETLAAEVVKLLGAALKDQGAMQTKLNSLEPAHYTALKRIETLEASLAIMQNQRDRAQKELRDLDAKRYDPKLKDLYETADSLRKAARGFKTLHPAASKLHAALRAAHDCLDWIPF